MAFLAERVLDSNTSYITQVLCPDIPQIRTEKISSSEINKNPILYSINTCLWLNQLSQKEGKCIDIGSVPEKYFQDLFDKFDCFWFIGINSPSQASQKICQQYPDSLRYAKPNVTPQDITGSPYAVYDHNQINPRIAKSWEIWNKRLDYFHQHGKEVYLDYVANHTAIDNPWAFFYPNRFIQATEDQFQSNPDNFHTLIANDGKTYHLVYGRDPYSGNWIDTLQLNYASPDTQQSMKEVLLNLVNHCDGVRCDMAMLLNPHTFIKTWQDFLSPSEIDFLTKNDFWPKIIPEIKAKAKSLGKKDFTFIAEAYGGNGGQEYYEPLSKLEKVFDSLYDKGFYDELTQLKFNHSEPFYNHLKNDIGNLIENGHKVIFFGNHDEKRAIEVFGPELSKSVALLCTLMSNNTLLIHQDEPKGFRLRQPLQLDQPLNEYTNYSMQNFYDRILNIKNRPLFKDAKWSILQNDKSKDYHIFTFETFLADKNISATVCINFDSRENIGLIPTIYKNDQVFVMNLDYGFQLPTIDQERNGGLFVRLAPYESQMIITYH